MLSALFSFSGRMGRLSYFLWSLAAIAVMIIPCTIVSVIMFAVMMPKLRGISPIQLINSPQFYACIAVPVLLVMWPAMALLAKRLRDIGLPPLISILVYASFLVFDRIVIAHFLHMPSSQPTIVGGVVQVVVWLFVMFMPGRAPDSHMPDLSHIDAEIARMRRIHEGAEAPTSRAQQMAPRPTQQVIRARMPQPAASGPPAFGRRR